MKIFSHIAVLVLVALFFSGTEPLYSRSQLESEQTEVAASALNDQPDAESNEDGKGHEDEVVEKEFDTQEYIMDHIKDSHEWHILTTKEGKHVSLPLPVILISKNSGFHIFMSSHLAHGHAYRGFKYGEGELSGKIVEVDESGALQELGLPLDFSITKNVFMMMLSVVILIWLFLSLAKSYKKSGISEPRGIQGLLEPLIVFIEDEVARPNIGEQKYARYMPYLLAVFFFILINNLMGLIPFFPFGANVTGNIAVTMVLALFTLLITTFSGNRGYWQHIFNTPGVPVWLSPIMIPVEIIGMFTKPFALMMRLFANITAGHIVVLSLIAMIFIFKSLVMAIPSVLMVLFMDLIELLVAFLQAYIFTLLSALFIGLAMPEHHHD